MKEKYLVLIRHGKTEANEKGLYCGQTDLPLSESGEKEIFDIKKTGVYPIAGMYFSSDMTRAAQTLTAIYGDVPYKRLPELNEYNFGCFEMKSYEDLKENKDYLSWISDTTGDISCTGGESRNSFRERVKHGFASALAEAQAADEPAVVVCHGGVIVTIMEELFPGIHNFYEWQPSAGRGYMLGLNHEPWYKRL